MSFFVLHGLETCPRQWALSAAEYPNIWDKRGYPRPLRRATIEGTVVHLSLQNIAYALAQRGCSSLADENAVSTLRELGGYTAVVFKSLDQVLRSYEANPRATPMLEAMRSRLESRIPELRAKVQKLLARIDPKPSSSGSRTRSDRRAGTARRELANGVYTEIELRADQLGWHGVADLITISDTACEIRDFKTGALAENHQFQLQVYALLWARDRQLNPKGRLATRLVLSYDWGDTDVPALGDDELRLLEDELRGKTTRALADLHYDPPEARPSPDNCSYCPVRQLCEDYWAWHAQQSSDNQSYKNGYGDIQMKVSGQHGPRSWDGVVEAGLGLKAGLPILLRTAEIASAVGSGQQLRLLNVHVSRDDEDVAEVNDSPPLIVATMGASSEAFLVT